MASLQHGMPLERWTTPRRATSSPATFWPNEWGCIQTWPVRSFPHCTPPPNNRLHPRSRTVGSLLGLLTVLSGINS